MKGNLTDDRIATELTNTLPSSGPRSELRSGLDESAKRLKIMLITGEASGDHHGASLVKAIRDERPDLQFEFFGSGGAEMRAAGVEIVRDIATFNIVGAEEFLTGFRRIWKAFYGLRDTAVERKPDLIVFIDYPDFNMRLARKLKRLGFATVYYITPQVWAWRQHRVRALRRDFDKLLVILPFEKDFYEKSGVPVEFVGHPLLDSVKTSVSREEFCNRYGLDSSRKLIALLPGSRRKEIKENLPHILGAVEKLGNSDFDFVLPRASTIPLKYIMSVATAFGGKIESNPGKSAACDTLVLGNSRIHVLQGDAQNAIRQAVLAVAASGTIVLETGVIGTPMIVVYRVSWLNWRLFRWMIKVDYFGLVNLIAGREVVPELIQNDFTGNRLYNLVIEVVGDNHRLERIRKDLDTVREQLGTGASSRAARAVLQTIAGIKRGKPHQSETKPVVAPV